MTDELDELFKNDLQPVQVNIEIAACDLKITLFAISLNY